MRLKISANSTRRSKWHVKLGFYERPWPFTITLNSVHEFGGTIGKLSVFVLLVYPMMFVVKGDNEEGRKTSMKFPLHNEYNFFLITISKKKKSSISFRKS